jgi:hypothetical protein
MCAPESGRVKGRRALDIAEWLFTLSEAEYLR